MRSAVRWRSRLGDRRGATRAPAPRRLVPPAWAVEGAACAVGGGGVGLSGMPDLDAGPVIALVTCLATVAACLSAARRGGPDSRAWWLLGSAVTIWAAAQVGDRLFPSFADLGHLAFAVPAAAGLLSLRRPVWPRGRRELLDGLVVVTSLCFITWTVVGRAGDGGGADRPTAQLAPWVATSMAALVLVMATGRAPRDRLPWLLVSGGLLALSADAVYGALAPDGVTGAAAPLRAVVQSGALVLIGLAALAPSRPRATPRPGRFPVVAEVLFHVPVIGVLVTSANRMVFEDPVLTGVGLAVLVLVAARHLVVTTDHLADPASLHDPLTELANRTLLIDRLDHALARQRRQSEPLALLLLDLDGFKLVNDGLGHEAGDDVLRALALRLRAGLRSYDTIARLGGDEFAVVLENTGQAQARAIAEQILAVVRTPVHTHGHSINPDASVGIATSTSGGETPQTLLRNADLAMYAAKDSGKGTVTVFTPSMHETTMRRLKLDGELRQAIDGDQFGVAYQPIVSLVTGRLEGFEALIRWHHPVRGVVRPDAFIPVAENAGLIVTMGRWVLREACRQAAAWGREHPGGDTLTMSVNLSARQLHDPQIVDTVVAALADAGLPAARLQLEITEGALDHRQSTTILDRLHAIDIRLALDDFGTGYSSLSRLHTLPIDRVKIDKSFVDALHDGRPAPVVAATIAMAHSLGLQTVAEGVETVEQLPFLFLHHCDDVQGYLFGRAVSAAATDALLRQRGTGTDWTEPAGTSRPATRHG